MTTNKPFSEKLNKENGFRDSRLWLNHNLQAISSWGEEEIKNRASLLAGRAIEIWSFPQSSYRPMQKVDSQLSIYDDYNFTGTKPKSFVFIEEEHSVGSWRELYQKSAKLLYTLDSVAFERLVAEPDSKRYMASAPQYLREAWKLGDGIHLEVNLSTDGIIGVLKYLFEAYNIDESDFAVVLREDTPVKMAA